MHKKRAITGKELFIANYEIEDNQFQNVNGT